MTYYDSELLKILNRLNDTINNTRVDVTTDKEYSGTWAFCQRYEQTDVGGGNLVVNITPATGETMLLLLYKLEVDNIAAAVDCFVGLYDENDNTLQMFDRQDLDNNRFMGPPLKVLDQSVTTTGYSKGASYIPFEVTYPDYIRLTVGTVAQNDGMEVFVRGKIETTKPTVAIASSGTIAIDGTFTDDYDKVI